MYMKTCFVDGQCDGVDRIQKMGLEIMALDNLGRRHLKNEVISKSR